ncbi:MAG: acetyl-CoA C-acyltransferase [Chitinophagales bacterium]|nr:acetyl-CoA C-acyltransferase [Chitinophagales bacterium]MDW8394031.1 acetyl-CoA C-acyltransferase [Chitinophagales bacterium]
MKAVYLLSIARTPIGSLGGSLASVPATELGAIAVRGALERSGLEPKDVQEVYMGNVLSANLGQAPAQQVSIAAGIPTHVPCTTVNKVCASGMKAIMLGAQSIMTGINEVVVCGGMESMSNAPYYLAKARFGYRYGNSEVIDAIVRDGLQDPYSLKMMGNAGELCARTHGISREEQDQYARLSYERAQQAMRSGAFHEEIVPVEVTSGKERMKVTEDEEPGKVKYDKIPTLKPAFEKDGTITAANASKINDGAAAVVLAGEEVVKRLNRKPLARILGFADASQEPDWFTTTPALAMPKAMKMAGLKPEEADLYEINEAFSVVALINARLLNIDTEKLNVFGGAVALGHPIGSSGARIIVTLTNALRQKGKRIGLAGICNGGGGASALVLESHS